MGVPIGENSLTLKICALSIYLNKNVKNIYNTRQILT